jgi:hypothetical protein
MTTRLCVTLAGVLLLVRVPSLVQPMGADQGLYAYVGERILVGDVPYRDAWDQKPPAIHFTYAILRAVWKSDAVVAAADLIAAACVGGLLFQLGTAVAGRAVGTTSALLFLLLSNPAFTRVGGVRLRGQAETFIAVALTAAFLFLVRERVRRQSGGIVAAGLMLGIACVFKYNTAVYAVAAVAAMCLWNQLSARSLGLLCIGFCVPVVLMLSYFAATGTLSDLYEATIAYNVQYSGETYAGPLDAIRYLLTFPIERARVDALWTVGGAGCLVLLTAVLGDRNRLIAPLWVGAACLSIAINGSRGLPQYFVQANPALALAAGWGAAIAWKVVEVRGGRHARPIAIGLLALVAVGVWRVNQFPKLVEQTLFDARYAFGGVSADEHLARYSDERKYSPLQAAKLAEFLRAHSANSDRVYVFGFSCAAYVDAGRASASRFFWSRPVIVGFNRDRPGYGASGVLAELTRHSPAVVALQRKDWAPDVMDSAAFFMGTPILAEWLQSHYQRADGPDAFDVWVRKTVSP